MSQCFKDVRRRDEIQHNNIDPQLTTSLSETAMPGGTVSHVMVCSKIQKQLKIITSTEQKKTKKTQRKMDTFFGERTITKCKARGEGGESKGKKK